MYTLCTLQCQTNSLSALWITLLFLSNNFFQDLNLQYYMVQLSMLQRVIPFNAPMHVKTNKMDTEDTSCGFGKWE